MTNKKKTSKPIFFRIVLAVGFLVIVEILILTGTIFAGGVTTYLNQNEKDILHEKVLNRKNYLETEMVSRWSNVLLTVQTINEKTQQLIDNGDISLKNIDDGSVEAASLIDDVSSDLIDLMRMNQVTGSFLILNTADLSEDVENKPGLYMRDLDPVSMPSVRNMDILLERGAFSVAKKYGLSTDTSWHPTFNFSQRGYIDYFYEPFMAAYNSKENLSVNDLGYWSGVHAIDGDTKQVISYSVPLMLNDGTVYGVLGIELTVDYINSILPYDEISGNGNGSYALIRSAGDSETYENVIINGSVYSQAFGQSAKLQLVDNKDGTFQINSSSTQEEFLCGAEKLNLYNSNAPFADEKWQLIGAVKSQDLFAFSNHVIMMIAIAIFVTLLFGILGAILISAVVSRPVTLLIKDMKNRKNSSTQKFKDTGISEIDRLVSSIEALNRDIIDSSTKFSQIIEMASVRLSGFEVNKADNALFVTKGFFGMFERGDIDIVGMGASDFIEIMKSYNKYIVDKEYEKEKTLYKIPAGNSFVYLSLSHRENDERYIGLIEDVTATMHRVKILEHERDHDILTTLINRRAFYEIMNDLFSRKENVLKNAALIMIDLDNLKALNDTYGHDCGDKYIKNAAECFANNTPDGTIITRVSGDEFYIFFYGYDNREEIIALINELKNAINSWQFAVTPSSSYPLRVSGGISWYPDDADNFELLLKHSDFAMYCVKRSGRGRLSYFDKAAYANEENLLQSKEELTDIIHGNKVYYCFQPIVNLRTGDIFAYEALMRSNMPNLNTPDKILTVAKMESKLDAIEKLTWFNALEAYATHVRCRNIKKGCKIFINSISNQALRVSEIEEIAGKYSEYLSDIVLEITESESIRKDAHQLKYKYIEAWGATMALDDYGSGYNDKEVLMRINPKYVKIDKDIIHDVNLDISKQKTVDNIVCYAHERDMLIIAEGVEKEVELKTVIDLGVDYVQGYFIAMPGENPPDVSGEAMKCINRIQEGK